MTEQELMLATILQCDRTALYIQKPQLSQSQEEELRQMVERRQQNEPLQYILKETDFMGSRIKVDSRVLIPRPETELLVEHVSSLATQKASGELRILDVGTGSGNIAIALAKELNASRITAIDVSEDALRLARENSRFNGVAHLIDFVHVDFFEFVENYSEAEKRFDIIISNPPYISAQAMASLPPDVKQEPVLALDGGEDGLKFYRVLIAEAKRFLKPDGLLACEIGDGQKESISQVLSQNGFENFYFRNDYRDTPRFFICHCESQSDEAI